MKVRWTSILVDDQKKALKFYTEILGFMKKTDVPLGEHSWLTVVSKEEPGGVEGRDQQAARVGASHRGDVPRRDRRGAAAPVQRDAAPAPAIG